MLEERIEAAVLKPNSSAADIKKMCQIVKSRGIRGIAVAPIWVDYARALIGKRLVISVVDFPFGYSTTEARLKTITSTRAHEYDVVMPITKFKSKQYKYVYNDLSLIVSATRRPVKVIIETGYLTKDEIIKACKIAAKAGAAAVKNSTGWGPRGATIRDIKIMRKAVNIAIKAAGGIRSRAQALALVRAGADYIGTSKPLELLKKS